jgi:hypothetical protein
LRGNANNITILIDVEKLKVFTNLIGSVELEAFLEVSYQLRVVLDVRDSLCNIIENYFH